MHIIKVQGGIGNQLFQWALYKSLELSGIESYLDVSGYNNLQQKHYRPLKLNEFPYLTYKTKLNINNFTKINDNFIVKEFKNDGNYYLDGYWQNEKYFIKYKNEILKELLPSSKIIDKIFNLYPYICNCISLHVRRGDYVNLQAYHPVQTIEYYDKALSYMKNYEKILVFSDDIKWCKENLKYNNMIFIEGLTDIEEMYCMSFCRDNIIANSTFSWWGAYMNKNPDKIVIGPSKWFGESYKNLQVNQYILDSWIKI